MVYMKAMTVRLPDELHEQLRRLAFDERVSMNEIVVEAVAEALTQRGKS